MERLSTRATRSAIRTVVRTRAMLSTRALPTNDRGDVLDPDVYAFLRMAARRGKFDPTRPVGMARREYDTFCPLTDVPPRALPRVESLVVEGASGPLNGRLYAPRESRDPMRCIVWLHGGGFVMGGLRSHDHALRALAADADAIVVAIDYRKGPEHRFPAAHDDAAEAFRWVMREAAALGIDRARIAIGGDSAGANLATSTCAMLRDAREELPALQVLVYPPSNIAAETASKTSLAEGFLLTRPMMDWFMERYMRPGDEVDPRLSVALADLKGLPRAIVSTAGFDPLRDEGDSYAALLEKAGVRVDVRPEPRLIHGWLTLGGVVPEARRALHSLAVAIRGALGG